MAEMTLTISAVDKASAVVKSVEGSFDGMKGKIKSAFDSIKDNFTSLHFAVTDAMAIIGKAIESVSRYAGYAEIKEQLNLMANQFGVTGDSIVASLKKVTGGQLSLEQATTTAAAALKNSLTIEQITGLATAAAAFADTAGVSVAQAFETLTDAVAKGNARAVASITGKDGLGDAMKTLESSASDAEKTMAIYNAVMEKTAEQSALTGDATFALADQIDQMKAMIDDAKIKLGEQMTKAALYLTSVVLQLVAGFENLVGAIGMVGEAYARYIQRDAQLADAIGARTDAIFKMAEENKALAKTFQDAASVIGKADEVLKTNAKSLGTQAVALGESAAAVDAANSKWQLIGGTWTQVNSQAATVAAGFGQIKTAADSIPKDVQVKVTTTYVEVRKSSAAEGESGTVARTGANGEASYGNWEGAYGN